MEIKNLEIGGVDVEIRTLEIGDMASLAKLNRHFWNEESDVEEMERKFCDLQNNPSYIFLCAVEGAELVGSIMGIVCDELYGTCKPFLVVENMVVDPKYRRKGIAKLLFEELEKQSVIKGCRYAILVTDTEREGACKFYESVGFHPTKNKGYKKYFI
ncbi:MAG: GNAT family N-acetyltransferase [Methanimicrococcus sp.]|nr:GNAT family N-acetyltransferase [Methanimicrococcus sp.]